MDVIESGFKVQDKRKGACQGVKVQGSRYVFVKIRKRFKVQDSRPEGALPAGVGFGFGDVIILVGG